MSAESDPLRTRHGAGFPETDPSLLTSRDPEVIARLVRWYLPPLKVHLIRRFGLSPDGANDMLQAFIVERVVSGPAIMERFDPDRGKFRTLLLTALDNFVRSAIRRDGAAKRAPSSPLGDIDAESAMPASGGAGSEGEFEREWARGVIIQAVEQMRGECARDGRDDLWLVFDCKLIGPLLRSTPDVPYEALVQRLGAESPRQVQNLLTTARRRFVSVVSRVGVEHGAAGTPEQILSELFRALRG